MRDNNKYKISYIVSYLFKEMIYYQDDKTKKKFKPRDVMLTIYGDEYLRTLCPPSITIIPFSGAKSFIHPHLTKKNKRKR